MGKFNRSLVKLSPAAPAEQHFADKHTIASVTDKFLVPDNGIFDQGRKMKEFRRKENRFGNDESDSITQYESYKIFVDGEYIGVAPNAKSRIDAVKHARTVVHRGKHKKIKIVTEMLTKDDLNTAYKVWEEKNKKNLFKENDQLVDKEPLKPLDVVNLDYFINEAKAVKARIPVGLINAHVDKYHVSKPEEEIEKEFRDSITKSKSPWTPELANKAVAHAIRRHRDNINLYKDVMGGNIGFGKVKEGEVVSLSRHMLYRPDDKKIKYATVMNNYAARKKTLPPDEVNAARKKKVTKVKALILKGKK